jgi:flagellar protein FliL
MEHIKTTMPHVRNRLLLLLSSKKAGEILSMEGKKKLSAEIVEQIRQPFTPQGPSPEVSNVFFTSFVVQ